MIVTLHRATPVVPAKKIRVGIIGAGTWAEYGHIPSLALLPDFELTAVYSRSAEKAHAVAACHRIAHPVTSLQALVEHPEVDLVVILTQAPQHEAGIRAAIAAGKDVYSEWPLTTSTAVSRELVALADQAGVRHVVGLQRRLAPSYRYVADLLAESYIGTLRSVRMHVSVDAFGARRMGYLAYTVPPENFSDLLPIFGGHFLDILCEHVGFPETLSALTANQIKQFTVIDTGETLPHTNPDQVLIHGAFANGAVLTVQLEAGKRNNFGVQIDLTGTEADLRITNGTSFGPSENVVEGAQGDAQPLQPLPVPAHQKGRAIAIAMAGTPLALTLGIPAGTWVGNLVGWRVAFGLLSALAALLMVWIAVKLPTMRAEPGQQRQRVASVFVMPGVRPVLAVLLLYVVAHNMLYTYIAPLAALAQLADRVDFLLALFGGLALASLLAVGVLVDRWLGRLVMASTVLFLIASGMLTLWPNAPAAVYMAVGIWGLAFGGVATLFVTALSNAAGAAQDVAQSMMTTVWNLVIFAGSGAGGMLLGQFGATACSYVAVALLCATLTILWRTRMQRWWRGAAH